MIVETLTDPVHLEIIGLVILPGAGFWLSWWIQHKADVKDRNTKHTENQVRLGRIETVLETKLDPVWEDWRSRKYNGGKA